MTLKRQKFYIVKRPDEELHKVMVGDVPQGTIKALSKILPDKSIAYKIYVEDNNKQIDLLVEGVTGDQEYDEITKKYESEMLLPNGNQWQEVQPEIIERE